MFVDASVIVAVLSREPDGEEIANRLSRLLHTDRIHVSPMVRFEAVAALARKKANEGRPGSKPTPGLFAEARASVDAFVLWLRAVEIDLTPTIGSGAIEAGMAYGKMVGHPADLNLGDCFAYACAKSLGVPLIYKGNDFALTDLA